ncbi:hypothetical protein [Pseudonocardia sp. HH130629-09]|uniref:hypothetical protein n=1 Tax=Pseudonocardia sp. HH130629-09 TaxID=1641402 RepID=UPI000761A808|nr:hypothetical protein [Pseudonocardia sp. HH130629-09]
MNSKSADHTPGDRAGTDAPVSTTAANLFDLRSVIALLFGVYGIVLLIMGIVSGNDPENLAKTGGTNLNLDTGIGMLVIGVLFVLWVYLRPLKLAPPAADEQD